MINRVYKITLLLLSTLLPTIAAAYDFEVDGIYYNINGNEATVTCIDYGTDSYSGHVTIPANVTYDGEIYSVTSIDEMAFAFCGELTSITIPNSIISIGYHAFFYCSGLTSISVESGNLIYDSRNNCNAIIETATNKLILGCMNTTIPNSITSIGNDAFRFCWQLTSIDIPNSVTSIGNEAFRECWQLTKIDIPNSVTSIGDCAFCSCNNLASVTIPNSVTSIGKWAFCDCYELASVTIPNSVTFIGDSAFYGCSELTHIVVDSDNPNYDSRNDCNAIIETATNTLITGCKNTIIPNTVNTINHDAFNGCSMTIITIPNSVTSIGEYAFGACSRLTSVTCLATTPPTIHNNTFSGVTNQGTLYVPVWSVEAYQTANYWQDFHQIVGITLIDDFEVDGVYYRALSENTVMVIQKPGEEEYYQGDVVVPDCVSHQDMQFTVTAIDARAFEDCYDLNSVVIGNAVESIAEEAFQGCTGLTSVTIGSGVTNIGAKAFNYCNVLQLVTCEGTVPPVMENSNCFSSAAYRRATLKVPRLFVDAYNAADYWYKFEQIEGFGSIGPGDVNADGGISITDVTALIGLVLGSGEYNADADLNNNGKLDIGDVTSLIVLVLSM